MAIRPSGGMDEYATALSAGEEHETGLAEPEAYADVDAVSMACNFDLVP